MAEQKYPQGLPWKWHPKSERAERNGSIFSMKHPGHAYAVAMQPRYVENDQWAQDAALIVRAVNSHDALVKALRELAYCDGSVENVANAEALAARVRRVARHALTEAGGHGDPSSLCEQDGGGRG